MLFEIQGLIDIASSLAMHIAPVRVRGKVEMRIRVSNSLRHETISTRGFRTVQLDPEMT